MAKSVIVKMRKINNVAGNLRYLADKNDHPDLCYVYGTCMDQNVWKEYAQVNQKEFAASGAATKGYRCVEAREAIYIFPQEYYNLPKQELERICREVVKEFAKKHGVDVYAAMHGNDKDSNNLHIHIMYMERTKEDKGCKIATRRLYFDDRGRQVKSRKYAVDEAGNLLPGYSYVKKGESYGGSREWSPKNQYLHSNQFTHAIKIDWANWLNKQRRLFQEPTIQVSEERTVYDRKNSPYLPMQNLPARLKYSNKEKQKEADENYEEYVRDIKVCNELRKEYNEVVKAALENGADLEKLIEYRKQLSAEIYEETKIDHSKTRTMLDKALEWVEGILNYLEELKMKMRPSEDKPKNASLFDKIKSAEKRVSTTVQEPNMRTKSGHDYGGR